MPKHLEFRILDFSRKGVFTEEGRERLLVIRSRIHTLREVGFVGEEKSGCLTKNVYAQRFEGDGRERTGGEKKVKIIVVAYCGNGNNSG